MMSKLNSSVWENKNVSLQSKLKVYQACVLRNLLYGSETWTTDARQKRKLNVCHMRCLRKILSITWKDKITNSEILRKAMSTTIFCNAR